MDLLIELDFQLFFEIIVFASWGWRSFNREDHLETKPVQLYRGVYKFGRLCGQGVMLPFRTTIAVKKVLRPE